LTGDFRTDASQAQAMRKPKGQVRGVTNPDHASLFFLEIQKKRRAGAGHDAPEGQSRGQFDGAG
jgi:hypothetical protein